jgi:hypothetical protein
MSDSPAATAVTIPVAVTVATVVFEDCQVAELVTSWDAPFDIVADALNCEFCPAIVEGEAALTVTDATFKVVELGAAGLADGGDPLAPPQLTNDVMMPSANTNVPMSRPIISPSDFQTELRHLRHASHLRGVICELNAQAVLNCRSAEPRRHVRSMTRA